MALQFERGEHERRIAAAQKKLRERGLDALLVFAQESHYYLTGFDTNGYVFFQCAVLTADERPMVLLTRKPDLAQARITSIMEDIRIWYDTEDADPAEDLKSLLAEMGLAGARVGIELATYGLTAANYVRIERALTPWCRLEDGSEIVRSLRLVKSPAEIAYTRKAAELADNALAAMIETAGPGVFEGDVQAAGQTAIWRGGGDVAASGPVLGSGERALLIRNSTGPRKLDPVDQLTMEFAGVYRRYHACIMRTVAIGSHDDYQRRMFEATRDAVEAMSEAAKPGRPLGEIDDAHRRTYDKAGFEHARMAACGYSLGATYRPNWMDTPPMLFSGNRTIAQAGMVLFTHAILVDRPKGYAMSAGRTLVVTETGCEVLSTIPVEYALCRAGGWGKARALR
ncbi:MAG: Xaa-Pro peptidase family protein [Rhodospirillaceae bacterium]|nr:Xaa-Pro peptidase family protein [Rhodospirillaceae bacterium]